jgi:hypothetical protein
MGISLYLDDVRPKPEGDNWLLVKTVPELIVLIKVIGDQIDLISLDHDLGEDTPSGYEFINWLEQRVFSGEYSDIPELRVHSANPVGRKKMEIGIISINRKLKYLEQIKDPIKLQEEIWKNEEKILNEI